MSEQIRSVSQRSTLRAVSMPTEHGGWSLTLEPAILGLLVVFTWPGLALGAAAMLGFLARTPLKIVLGDIWRKRWLDRSVVGAKVAVVEVVIFLILVAYALLAAKHNFLLPVIISLPLVAIQLYFDVRSKSRRLIPELAGTIGIGSIAAVIALAGGTDAKIAYGLWVVVGARAVAAIPYARTQVFKKRGRDHRIWHSDLAQVVALIAISIGLIVGAVSLASALAILFVAAFNFSAVRAKPLPAKFVGFQQMFFGIGVILITAIST